MLAAAIACIVVVGYHVAFHWWTPPGGSQDFAVVWSGAAAMADGVSPYAPAVWTAGGPLSFTYPPHVAWLLQPLAWLDFRVARDTWFVVELLAFLAIARAGRQVFAARGLEPAPAARTAALAVFAFLAFDGAALTGLHTGNLVLVEVALLWTGWAALADGRRGTAALLLLAAGSLKLLPLALLPTLALDRRPGGARLVVATVALAIAILGTSYAVWAELWRRWFEVVTSIDERGAINPCLLELCRSVERAMRSDHATGTAAVVAWGALASAAAGAAGSACRAQPDVTARLALATTTYAVLAPRFKDYTYLLVLAPTAWLLATRLESTRRRTLAALALVTPWPVVQRFGLNPATQLAAYSSWFLVATAWLLALRGPRSGEPQKPGIAGGPAAGPPMLGRP